MADLAWRSSSLTSRNSRVYPSSSAWDASLIQPDSLCVQCANFCGSSVAKVLVLWRGRTYTERMSSDSAESSCSL